MAKLRLHQKVAAIYAGDLFADERKGYLSRKRTYAATWQVAMQTNGG